MTTDDDQAVFIELLDQLDKPSSAERRHRVSALTAFADEKGLIHSELLGRFIDMLDLQRITDIDHVAASLTEVQQRWRKNLDRLDPQFTPIMLTQMALGVLAIWGGNAIEIERVESLRSHYEELCRFHRHTLRVPYRLAMVINAQRGNIPLAKHYYEQMQSEAPDPLMPDNLGDEIQFLEEEFGTEAAVEAYGRLDTNEPHAAARYTHAMAVLPLYDCGKFEEAERAFLLSDPDDPYPFVLPYLSLTKRFDQGLAMLGKIENTAPEYPETELGSTVTSLNATIFLGHMCLAQLGDTETPMLGGGTVGSQLQRYAKRLYEVVEKADELCGHHYGIERLKRHWKKIMPEVQTLDDILRLAESHPGPTAPPGA